MAKPLSDWCLALWNRWAPRHEMLGCFNAAYGRALGSVNPWTDLWGPSSVVAATLIRFGWEAVDPVRWRTHRGVVNVDESPPRCIEALATEAARMLLWGKEKASHPELHEISPLPLMKPVMDLLHAKSRQEDWTSHNQGQLRMAVVNGRWPQSRLFEAGYVEDPRCSLCKADRGTNFHDLYGCDSSAIHRGQYSGTECADMFRCARASPERPLWTRALVSDPSFRFPPPIMQPMIVWEKTPAGRLIEGIGYGDGSGMRPTM
jgi:hypothetical protein